MNPLALYAAWRARHRAARDRAAAERRRKALIAQKAYRRAAHMPSRYLDGLLLQATSDSLRAEIAGRR